MAVMSQEQVMGQLRAIIPAVGTIVAALGIASVDKTGALVAGLLTAVGPISYLITAIWSAFAHTEANTIKTVQAIATGPASASAVSAQTALIEATSAVAADSSIPKSTEAKAALLDATASLPEVVGRITVTDPSLVVATTSNQIQKAA